MQKTILTLCFCLFTSLATAEDELVDKWMSFYADRASKYEIVVNENDSRKLEFQSTPLLKYTNPVRQRGQHGAVFAWTLDGRPQAIGTIWSVTDTKDLTVRRVAHELHSLCEEPLSAKRPAEIAGRLNPNRVLTAWLPARAGVKFEPLASDRPIPKTAAGRLSQMRGLAKEFTAEVLDRKTEQPSSLRLLPSPLIRYESKKNKVIDGCLFAFVLATDPELFLLVECRAGDENAQPSWHFAAARFTGLALRLNRRQTEVWRCEKADTPSPANAIYNLNFSVSVLPADFPNR